MEIEVNDYEDKWRETTTTVTNLFDSIYEDEILTMFQSREFKSANEVQLKLYDILVPILGGAIILLNFAVVISSGLILRTNVQPRSTYLFLGNVALADLLSGIAIIFGQFYPKEYRDAQFCSIQMGMIVSAIITSVYSIGLISVDRYLYIVYGLQYQRYIYPLRARIMIICTWILGIIIGFLPAMGWIGNTDNGRICWFVTVAPLELILLTTTLGLLPIIVTIVLYSLILYHALQKVVQLKKAATRRSGHQSGNLRVFVGGRQHQQQQQPREAAAVGRQPLPTSTSDGNADMSSGEDADASMTHGSTVRRSSKLRFWKCFRRRDTLTIANQSSPTVNGNTAPTTTTTPSTSRKTPSKWTAIKVVALTTGCFVITWVPFLITSTWFVFCDKESTPTLCNNLRIALTSTLSILGFTNGLFNPIIYAWWHNGFRRSIKTIFRKCCQRRNQSTNKQTINPLSSSINIAYTTPTNSSTATAYTIASNSSTEVLNASDTSDTDGIVSNNITNMNRDRDVHLTTITMTNTVRHSSNNDRDNNFPKKSEKRNTQ